VIQRPYVRTLSQALALLADAHETSDATANALIKAFVGDCSLQKAFFDFCAARTSHVFKSVDEALTHLQSGVLYEELDAFQADLLLRDFVTDSGRAEQFYAYADVIEKRLGREAAVIAARSRPIIETLPHFR
jgi:hypothetical protein